MVLVQRMQSSSTKHFSHHLNGRRKEEIYHSSTSVTTQEEYFLCYKIREVHSKGNVLMKKALSFYLI